MSEVKQEGDFKLKAKPKKPKNLGKKNEITKVELKEPVKKVEEEVTKVVIPKEEVKKEDHFVSIRLHVDPKDNTNILLYEEWDDLDYYKSEHMNTVHLTAFIAKSRSFLAGPPEVTFWSLESEF